MNGQRPVVGMHAKVGLPLLFHFPFTFTYKQECQYDNHAHCLCFDSQSAVARLTVYRADAYVTPTCVFPINNSNGFWGEAPILTLTNRVHFYSGCGLRIQWGCTLAPRKFTEDMPLHPANLPMKELFGLHSLYPWGCNSGLDFLWTYRNVDCDYVYCICLVRFFDACYIPIWFHTQLCWQISVVLHLLIVPAI